MRHKRKEGRCPSRLVSGLVLAIAWISCGGIAAGPVTAQEVVEERERESSHDRSVAHAFAAERPNDEKTDENPDEMTVDDGQRQRSGDAEDKKARLEAIAELTARGGAEAERELADLALYDPEPAVRREALFSVAEIGGELALPTLEQTLGDRDLAVRAATVDALADLGGDGAAWTLALALEDHPPAVRRRAIYALREIGGEVAILLLQRALADEELSLRELAAEVVDELADHRR